MPRFFGLYEGNSDGIGICCIVLEHCGMPLGQQGNLLCDQREDFSDFQRATTPVSSTICDEVRCIAEYADAWEPVSLYFPQAGGILGRKRLRLPQGVFYDSERPIDRERILTSVSPYVWAQIAPSAHEDDEVNWDRAREIVEEAVASYEQRVADRRKKLRSQEPDSESLEQVQREQ
ncbi:hypothetical protein FOMPIDRAFT_117058 [Fomitopsis schrenkii]|uniref:Uncharacterized protein n=1 Tax=Fomitopsis schrenkii TaxID=2126942 RepID=S8F5E9_FOMSC|nr:hypothetical protein FOMPIDRAFT_117058 [Fomitopsis schrenkii]